MTHATKVVIERDTQGGYVATFPEWVGYRAQASSLKTLIEQIQEALALPPDGGATTAAPRDLACVARDGGGG
jgi:hypothetical protein